MKTYAYGIGRSTSVLGTKAPNVFGAGEFREIELPNLSENEVLVRNFAAGLNYNSVWSALRRPADPFQLLESYVRRNPTRRSQLSDFQIIGSDSAGVVAEIGKSVKGWSVGDEVVIHCNVVDSADPITQIDDLLSDSQGIWGYETNFGAFSQYSIVTEEQLLAKPKHLTWEEAASYSLTLSTAYRMLASPNGANLRKDEVCLLWGAAGGLGHFGIQLCNVIGATPVAVVSSAEKAEACRFLGVEHVIDRSKVERSFVTESGAPNSLGWREFKRLLEQEVPGKIDVVFEHVGRETLALSIYLVRRGGRVVTCAAASGYECTIDLRYLWMNVKKLIGSHIANRVEARAANDLVVEGQIRPTVSHVGRFDELPKLLELLKSGAVIGKAVVTIPQ